MADVNASPPYMNNPPEYAGVIRMVNANVMYALAEEVPQGNLATRARVRQTALIGVYDRIWGYDTDKKWFSKCLYKN